MLLVQRLLRESQWHSFSNSSLSFSYSMRSWSPAQQHHQPHHLAQRRLHPFILDQLVSRGLRLLRLLISFRPADMVKERSMPQRRLHLHGSRR